MSQYAIILYEKEGFNGRELPLNDSVKNLKAVSFNDVTSSIIVHRGTWTLYVHVDYTGNQFTVGPGTYDVGVIREKIGDDVISSVLRKSVSDTDCASSD